MKLIKTFGLAIVAAVAAMAFLGAGTASAESPYVCEAASYSECTGGAHRLANGTILHAKLQAGTKAVLSGAFPVECEVSEVEEELTNNSPTQGEQVKGKITKVTFEKCGLCTAGATQLPWTQHLGQQKSNAKEEQDEVNGTFKGNGKFWVNPWPQGTEPNPGLQPGGWASCFGVKCAFHVKETQPGETSEKSGYLHAKGGNPATLEAIGLNGNGIELKYDGPESTGSEATCIGGKPALWKATYEIDKAGTVSGPSLWVAHT